MSLDEIRTLTQDLLATAPPIQDLLAAVKPPSRRRPRRKKAVTLRVRADLSDTKPPVWRRLELVSDLMLDEVDQIMQTAFGWTDSHLHQFRSGPSYHSPDTEYYLCPFMVDDGEQGVPEDQVRLDELLVDVGDKLFYTYDFGDNWRHVIRLEAVGARDQAAPRAVCTGGRGPAPAEDCGGVGGYALLVAATDPHHPDHGAARAEFAEAFGSDIDPRGWAPTPFEIEQINRELAGGDSTSTDTGGPLADLLDAMASPHGRRKLRRLIDDARLEDPVLIDADAAAAAVRPYRWLLNRVGDDGIKLTQAGYLPPLQVQAAFTELGLDADWIGAGNREDLTYPVLALRESAQRIGLLRKYRGRLLATARGRALRDDPVGLWRHIAERTPTGSSDPSTGQAELLYLTAVAAGNTEDPEAIVAELLGALGWVRADGSPISAQSSAAAAGEVTDTLRRLGMIQHTGSGLRRRKQLSDSAVDFARAALTTWRP